MDLYLLTVTDEGKMGYDSFDGWVIRATSEVQARDLASKHAADEGKDVWLSAAGSSCKVLSADGDTELILGSFNAG